LIISTTVHKNKTYHESKHNTLLDGRGFLPSVLQQGILYYLSFSSSSSSPLLLLLLLMRVIIICTYISHHFQLNNYKKIIWWNVNWNYLIVKSYDFVWLLITESIDWWMDLFSSNPHATFIHHDIACEMQWCSKKWGSQIKLPKSQFICYSHNWYDRRSML